MLVQSVRLKFNSENVERAESILRELRDATRREPGAVRFEVARVREQPNVFVVWEEYRDDAALDAHVAAELSIDIASPI